MASPAHEDIEIPIAIIFSFSENLWTVVRKTLFAS